MSEGVMLALAGVAGLVLSALSLGGLWWTVRVGVTSKQPGLLFLASLVVRTLVVVAGFYLVSNGEAKRLVACLVGYLVARTVITKLAGAPLQHFEAPAKEPEHAP